MKKVIFLAYDINLGLTLHFLDWVEALNRLGRGYIEFIFVTLDKEQNPGLLESLKNFSANTIIINKNEDLEKLDIFYEADIVHCHGFRQFSVVQKIKKRKSLKFKVIITMHAFKHGSWYRPLYTNFVSSFYLNKIELIHFLSQASKNEFLHLNFFYKKSNNSTVFPLGCRKERFHSDVSIEHLSFFKELIDNRKKIIYLADFIPRKNHMWIVRTLKNLLVQENAKLFLFGKGPLFKKIKKFIKDNSLEKYVVLPGRVDGKYIPNILKKMDIAICASKSETMGHNIIEPMFAGLPVVTFDTGVASYVIRDYVTGFIIKNKSEGENFKRAILFLLKNDDLAKKMGENAKLFAYKWLTWEVTAQNCIELYKQILLS